MSGSTPSLAEPRVLAVVPENIPSLLKGIDQWIVWKAEAKADGRINKIPIHAKSGRRINPHDTENHMSFKDAFAAYQAGSGSGIGFDLTGDPVTHDGEGRPLYLVGLDFDKVTESEQRRDYAKSVYSRLKCYLEISPSGTGLRMFALSSRKPRTGQSAKCEVYTGGRFLTVTGQSAHGTIKDATETFPELEKEFWPNSEKDSRSNVLPFPNGLFDLNRLLMGKEWEENAENEAKIKGALSHIPADLSYEDWRNIIWAIASLDWECGQELAEEWSATSEEHWERDGGEAAQRAIEQLFDSYDPGRGITVGTLLHQAYQHGMPRPARLPSALFSAPHSKDSSENSRHFRLLTRDDLDALPPMRWLVRGVLPETGIAAIYGEPGSGKSYLALDIAAHVSTGLPNWFGRPVVRRDVVYVALEGGRGMQQRQAAWDQTNGCKADRVRFLLNSFTVFDDAQVAEFIEVVTGACDKGAVVIIDTLAQATPGADENSAKDMGLVLQAARAIAEAIEGLVILVHHSGKDASRGLRGHSSLNGAMDAVIVVERDRQTNRRSWRVTKMKDGDDGASGQFQLEVVDLGPDGFGGRVTSCAVSEITGFFAKPSATPPVPKGVHQQAVYEALRGHPDCAKGWTQNETMKVAKDALGEVGSRYRATRAKEAIDGLIDGHLIKRDEGGLFSLTLSPPDHPPPAPP